MVVTASAAPSLMPGAKSRTAMASSGARPILSRSAIPTVFSLGSTPRSLGLSSLTTERTSPWPYVYKLTVDDGGAPCTDGGLLTLAICKPGIRTHAGVGDFICGSRQIGLVAITDSSTSLALQRSKRTPSTTTSHSIGTACWSVFDC
jgi:hypothetical protein